MTSQTAIGKIPVLMYHSISHTPNPRFKEFAVSPELFDQQMSYLFQRHYTPLTVTQLATAIREQTIRAGDKPIVLTFDDGYADFYAAAWPILKKYQFTATLYVTTGFVNGTSQWLESQGEANRPMLNWDQLGELAWTGIECGAHSHTHRQLDMLSKTLARFEVGESKRMLEDRLARPVSSFAYPYGYYTQTLERLVRHAGYSSACAVKYAMGSTTDDLFALPRLIVTGRTTLNDFAELLNGVRLPSAMKYYQVRSQVWRFVRRAITPLKHLSAGEYI